MEAKKSGSHKQICDYLGKKTQSEVSYSAAFMVNSFKKLEKYKGRGLVDEQRKYLDTEIGKFLFQQIEQINHDVNELMKSQKKAM